MATHSSILAWEIPGTEEPGGLQSMGSRQSDMTEQLNSNNCMKKELIKCRDKHLWVSVSVCVMIRVVFHFG